MSVYELKARRIEAEVHHSPNLAKAQGRIRPWRVSVKVLKIMPARPDHPEVREFRVLEETVVWRLTRSGAFRALARIAEGAS